MSGIVREIVYDQRIESLCIATPTGFSVFDNMRGNITYQAHFQNGGAEHVALLSDSNLIAASGDGKNGGYKRNMVILWDKLKTEENVVFELELPTPVEKLFFTSDALIVVREKEISFFSTSNFEEYKVIPNTAKSAGCISLVQTTTTSLMTVPSSNLKELNIVDYHDPLYTLCSLEIPVADISYAAFNRQGELLAVANSTGKEVKLYSINKQQLLATYKRGNTAATITGIVFDNLSTFFLMTSNKPTTHIFQVPSQAQTKVKEEKSINTYKGKKDDKKKIYWCQFDAEGYIFTYITETGDFTKLRIDVVKNQIEPIEKEIKLDLA